MIDISLSDINCRNVLSKLHDIQVLIDQCGANIISLTETWLNSGNDDFVSINGFKFNSSCGFVDGEEVLVFYFLITFHLKLLILRLFAFR